MEVGRNFLTKSVMVSVMARVALHNLFLDLQKRSKLCTVAQLFTEMSLDLKDERRLKHLFQRSHL